MQKIILITGSTDGIGLKTAEMLADQGHHLIIHGRDTQKVRTVVDGLTQRGQGHIESVIADLSSFQAIEAMISNIADRFGKLDVLINNAGVYTTSQNTTKDGLDSRFMVNSIAPYLLTKALLPLFTTTGRIINLSSAAQSPVVLDALMGKIKLTDNEAYAQSKLALTMWSRRIGLELKSSGPMVVSINPKSFLGSKMVKDAYGIAGGDLKLGADILVTAALSDAFSNAHGGYFDNDIEAFAAPHRDALNDSKVDDVLHTIDSLIERYLPV